ncbi:MAG: hypothetical protein R3C44_04980 [Chloroflexota bacterium]
MSNLPVRLVGKLDAAVQTRKIAGLDDLRAEYLRGEGEFIAIANGQQTYFQAADIGDYDLHWELNRLLTGHPRPRLLAQPYTPLATMQKPNPIQAEPRSFRREDNVQWVDQPQINHPTGPSSSAGFVLPGDYPAEEKS